MSSAIANHDLISRWVVTQLMGALVSFSKLGSFALELETGRFCIVAVALFATRMLLVAA